jgi:hypothetical protein
MPLVEGIRKNLPTDVQIFSERFDTALCNLAVKDTLKRQKTLHTGRIMRDFEQSGETLTHRTAAFIRRIATLINKNRREPSLL